MHSMRITLAAATLLAAVLPALSDEAADIAAISARRAALGKAYMDQDADAARKLMTADQRSVTFAYDGAETLDQQFASLNELDVEVYDTIPSTTKMLGPDAALVTYEQSYRGTYEGNPLPQRVYVSEVWVREGGDWLQTFYQETVIEVER